ncbi:helix-turn-helix domain-containing protein [Micromonospora sp. WMMC415]|uniref:GlxA family transcriptional regulator n=1 Tax=Micromonospora sp. WMMC415 TaxID=2675222 RepID=UPI0012B4E95E|nr:helix-turn-helix domain-containing protein [Micromonospora sp. WMMC415]QGN50501.1 helix-turn-helix domain-containing protein [Micromonospora sp. WMMC415]
MHRVALVLHETTMLYEAAIAAEIFGVDRSELSPAGDWYDLVVCTPDGRPNRWLPDARTARFDELVRADSVVVPSTDDPDAPPDPGLLEALARAHRRGVRIASLCTGAFVLAAAGLLDGRSATTHWMHADDLARQHPLVDVRADVLYTDDGQVLTSAGKTAALDLCLHLVRRDFGTAAANNLARRMVVPAHRAGGQAQFIAPPAAPDNPDRLGAMLEWARSRLDQPLTVPDLAREAGLSSRHLARRMRAELRLSPLAWLHQQRIARAQELLERSDASVEQIATRCGLGTATTLRRHFHKHVGVSPTAYRTAFHSLVPTSGTPHPARPAGA